MEHYIFSCVYTLFTTVFLSPHLSEYFVFINNHFLIEYNLTEILRTHIMFDQLVMTIENQCVSLHV